MAIPSYKSKTKVESQAYIGSKKTDIDTIFNNFTLGRANSLHIYGQKKSTKLTKKIK